MVQKTINIIDVITTKTNLKQMDIANMLGVSRAQISKWKSGEDIPYNRRQALNEMAGLFGDDTEWALLTKNPENAEDWINYFTEHNEFLDVDTCHTLTDEAEVWVPQILTLFNLIGIKIPENARNTDTDIEEEEKEGVSKFSRLMTDYLESYSALMNWYDWNISSIDDENSDIFESTIDFQSYIVDYALRFVDEEILTDLGADLSKVSKKVKHAKKEMSKLIEEILSIMLHNNIPIMKNYFDIINKEPYDLDDDDMFSSIEHTIGKSTIESCLPLFERTILNQNTELFEILGELHLKVDMLLKPEDKEKLSKILKVSNPLSSIMGATEE